MDKKVDKLAKLLVDYSINVKPNELVVISGPVEAQELIIELYKQVLLKGAHPHLRINFPKLTPFFYKHANPNQVKRFPKEFDYLIKNTQKYISIIPEENTKEMVKCNHKKIVEKTKVVNPITNYIVNAKPKIYRCTTLFPYKNLAKEAGMSLTSYKNFVFDACLQDWKKLGKQMDKILKQFKKNSKVHLIGKGVDLTMKVHGHKAVADKAEENMPGGEIFMAPVRTSLNGFIEFEYPSTRDGKEVKDIKLIFKNGKVIKATASKNQDFLKKMLSTDKNASYVGELGIGFNPKIITYHNQLLFDEKISGTIHLALGMAYKENGGGNDSAIHWDIVKDMKKAKIIVDGKVIQEKGVWKI